MKRLVWVEDEFFDSALHAHRARAMAAALTRRGVAVTAVCSFEHAPVPLPEFERVVWCAPCGPGAARNARFLAQAWRAVGREYARGAPDWVVLCKRTAPCAFPHDIRARLGAGKGAAILDLRTLEYGSGLSERSTRDRVLRATTRLGLAYSGLAHSGATAITPRLAAIVGRLSRRRRVGVWGSGWDPAAASAAPPRELLRALDGRLVAVYHGTLSPERGLVECLAAVDVARREVPDLLFVVVGAGPLLGALEEARARRGLSGHVVLWSALPHEQVTGLLDHADLAVVPYPDTEYWLYNHPIKIVECLGAGLPVVTRRNRGFLEAFPDCDALLQAEDGSPDALARVLVQVASSAGERARLGAAAREYAGGLTWDAQAGRLMDYLESLGGTGS